jgi:hypothetical protein
LYKLRRCRAGCAFATANGKLFISNAIFDAGDASRVWTVIPIGARHALFRPMISFRRRACAA